MGKSAAPRPPLSALVFEAEALALSKSIELMRPRVESLAPRMLIAGRGGMVPMHWGKRRIRRPEQKHSVSRARRSAVWDPV